MRKKVSAMLEIVVCDDDIADLECAVTMLHKIFTSQKIAYHIEQFASANQMLENISNIDIGILDISMEELNGIKLGRKFMHFHFYVSHWNMINWKRRCWNCWINCRIPEQKRIFIK